MRRLAVICSVVAISLVVLGVVERLTRFNWPADQNTLFGNPRLVTNDGTTVLITAGLLVIATALIWAAVLQKGRSHQQRP